jgi:hypothetical protein
MRATADIDVPNLQDIHDRDDEIRRLQAELESRREHANLHYTSAEFIGIDGYGPFSLKQLGKDQWEIRMLRERVILYNRKGRRVRGDLNTSNANYDGDW